MNQQQLIETVASKTRVTKAQVEMIFKQTLFEIRHSVKKGNEVKVVGFGTFKTIRRKQRAGRNPQTGQAITIPARRAIKFKPSEQWQTEVQR